MDDTRYHRQLDLLAPDSLRAPITVIGAGGIGSFTVLSLAKMGCTNITVYDFDTVENHNLPNQLYRENDIGKPKVEALKDMVAEFTGVGINAQNERSEGKGLSGIVILAVDSMDTRMELWQGMKYNARIPLCIDGRMGAEVMRVFSINPIDPDDIRRYEAELFPSSEAFTAPCTARSIIYTAFSVAALITGQVKKYAAGQSYSRDITFDARLTHMMVA
jgi:ThiF family